MTKQSLKKNLRLYWRLFRFRWAAMMIHEPDNWLSRFLLNLFRFFIRLVWLVLLASREYSRDNAFLHGAALAYYTIFSLPPMMLVISLAAGSFLGEAEVQAQLIAQVEELLGAEAAQQVRYMTENWQQKSGHGLAAIIGIGTLLLSSTAVFYNMQNSLNAFWKVTPKIRKGIREIVLDRILAFLMVLMMGIILLVALLVETIIVTLNRYFSQLLPDFQASFLLAGHYFVVFFVLTLLFSLIFRYLPNAILKWRETLVGAGFTSLLFFVGQWAIAWYISETDFNTTYGAAGSVIIILAWVFYSAQIIYFGAEFTYVYAKKYGTDIIASSHKRKIIRKQRQEVEPAEQPVGELSTETSGPTLPASEPEK